MKKSVQNMEVQTEPIKDPNQRKTGNEKFRDSNKNLRGKPRQQNKRDRRGNLRHEDKIEKNNTLVKQNDESQKNPDKIEKNGYFGQRK